MVLNGLNGWFCLLSFLFDLPIGTKNVVEHLSEQGIGEKVKNKISRVLCVWC